MIRKNDNLSMNKMIRVFKTIQCYFKEYKCFSPENLISKFAPISKDRVSISRIMRTGTSTNTINSSSNVLKILE